MSVQLGFGFGKGRRVIKTIVTGEALTRAKDRHYHFLAQHYPDLIPAAPVPPLAWQTSRVRPSLPLRMAKADLHPKESA